TMFDPRPGNALEGEIGNIGNDFSLELGTDLFSKKAHDFLGAKAQRAIADSILLQLSGEPLVSVDVHLYLKRKPGLQLDVDQAEVAVHEVVIKKQALAACGSPRTACPSPCGRKRWDMVPERRGHR